MFLIFRRSSRDAPRLRVVVAGIGVTDSSVSAHQPPAGAVTLVFCPVPVPVPAVDWPAPVDGAVPPSTPPPFWAPVPSPGGCDSRSVGFGNDGPPPGTPSMNDGSVSGELPAGPGVGSCDDGPPLPRWSPLSSPEQETN